MSICPWKLDLRGNVVESDFMIYIGGLGPDEGITRGPRISPTLTPFLGGSNFWHFLALFLSNSYYYVHFNTA